MRATLAKAFHRFVRNESGDTIILFALSIVPLLLAAGMAIDYVRYSTAKSEMQTALDAASLAAASASDLSNTARLQVAEATFAQDIKGSSLADAIVTHDFKIVSGSVEGSASLSIPTALMQLAGLKTMDSAISNAVSIPDKQKAEIALVLDYSGSMTDVLGGQVKYIAMKNAIKKMVNDLVDANPKNIKFGLVPFSGHIWVTLPNSAVLGQSGSGTWTGCTQDRKYPYNLTDDAPVASVDASKWGQPIAPLHKTYGCGAYVPNHLTVAPLTNDFAAINSQLDAMVPYAWTHIALGTEFGFHLLSPNAPFGQAAPYSDTKTRKFLVLATDGEQTEPAFGPGVRTVTQGESNLAAICENAKADGITVITIAYNIDDIPTVNRLRDCTSDASKDFFSIGTDNNIAQAFAEIEKQIASSVRIGK